MKERAKTGRTYWCTRPIKESCGGLSYPLMASWGFRKGDVVQIEISDIDEPGKLARDVKKVCVMGSSVGVYCNRAWGFERDQMVRGKITMIMPIEEQNESEGN